MNLRAGVLTALATSVLAVVLATAAAQGYAPGADSPATLDLTGPAPADPDGVPRSVTTSEVRIPMAGGARHALLTAPTGVPGPLPAAVLVHGAGPADRTALAAEAEALAAQGLLVIRYDKRDSESGFLRRDHHLLAEDAAAAAAWAAGHEDVDPERVGLIGWSEGGWVAPLAAAGNPGIAAVGLVSAPVVTPLENLAFTVDQAVAPAPLPLRATATTLVAGGRSLLDYVELDLREEIDTLDVPVHAVFGAEDPSIPVSEAVQRLRTVAPGASVEVVADAGHGMPVRPGWTGRMAALLAGSPGAPEPRSTLGVTPEQRIGLLSLPEPSPLLDPRLHLAASLAAGAAPALLVPRRPRPVRTQEETP